MFHIKIPNIQRLDMKLNHGSTPGLANFIRNKNKLYKSFCKEKDPKLKESYEKQFKSFRNHISSLLRKTKDSYYKQYFEDNKKILG